MSGGATWILVGALGGVGALARFLLDARVLSRLRSALPVGTLVVNLTGSLLLGLIAGLAPGGQTMLLAGTALMGSYTTMSTWMLESERLAEDGRGAYVVANVLLSLLAGLGAVALGRAVGSA